MPKNTTKQRIKGEHFGMFLLALIVGSFLRFYHIGEQPLWLDEAWSLWFSEKTLHDLWMVVPRYETNPPLYYNLLKIWGLIFGTTEAALRSLSAMMSIGCIPLIYIIGK